MEAIEFAGRPCLSFRQLDTLNKLEKGSTFRLFKRWDAQLVEGEDYHYLSARDHGALIQALKDDGRVYATTRHLVLITREGFIKLQGLASQGN